jgi:transcription elongation factor Elf1
MGSSHRMGCSLNDLANDMATAICQNCGASRHWTASRGAKLSDLRCDSCGGELKSAIKGKASKNRGKRYSVCAICGRKRLHARPVPFAFRVLHDSRTVHPAGSVVCPIHDCLPADDPYFALLDAPVRRELLFGWLDEIESWTKGPQPDDLSDDAWEY